MNKEFEEHINDLSDTVNVLCKLILDDFKEFIDHHLKGVDPIISGFIMHEIAQHCFATCMINGRNMANKAAEHGQKNIDVQGLLDSYKRLFDAGVTKMYNAYINKGAN